MKKFSDHFQRREAGMSDSGGGSSSGSGSSSSAQSVQVFDDFRAYKLRAIKSLNGTVFNVETKFLPLLVCKNVDMENGHVHNTTLLLERDFITISNLINSNGGFNFSLLSFDVSAFVLSPGYYVEESLSVSSRRMTSSFDYNNRVYNANVFRFPPDGIGPENEVRTYSVIGKQLDTSPILIYLEV